MSSHNPYNDNIKAYRDHLAVDYMPAVKSMAARLKERLPSSVDFNDLVSIGFEELVKLAKRYDPAINDNFWGYAQTRIYGAMLDFLRSLDTVSRGDRKLIKEIEKVIEKYTSKFNTEPSDEEIAEILDVDVEKVRKARTASDIYTVMPIEDQMNYFDDVSKKVEEEELIDKIMEVLEEFGEKEQMIIQLYYFEELSLKEISEILGVTESRVSQIHKKVIKKLRERLADG
ncbi:RNA polymerase sigma factor FliA [Caminibacter pacificus]|jgi:RNA polymerase sigma factor for flagellar operon FliA|uniref:RNA polymerase sigma factor FliA n=1 Tax=Caminibacter pacificus TaxID=1424653 RepID=A0AAJ4RDI1_9BACT|nr:RNA polymerase sigma factor FliA [Caminibacter pacificus]NPA87226.1 RNA polymerase sigma factor FliA [Campylobacterota bacterium]QCI28683.1 RNA polymerase sigma factor FliA [Caminibacter pacificus]ROR40586.1 RNA polymerase sigma-28 (SigD/FliA/WhiG) subunit [Caminibacter pacificus]